MQLLDLVGHFSIYLLLIKGKLAMKKSFLKESFSDEFSLNSIQAFNIIMLEKKWTLTFINSWNFWKPRIFLKWELLLNIFWLLCVLWNQIPANNPWQYLSSFKYLKETLMKNALHYLSLNIYWELCLKSFIILTSRQELLFPLKAVLRQNPSGKGWHYLYIYK